MSELILKADSPLAQAIREHTKSGPLDPLILTLRDRKGNVLHAEVSMQWQIKDEGGVKYQGSRFVTWDEYVNTFADVFAAGLGKVFKA